MPGFRPLSGSYISQSWAEDIRKNMIVSVPYRGATFLNDVKNIRSNTVLNSFRPLSGSYISQSQFEYSLLRGVR